MSTFRRLLTALGAAALFAAGCATPAILTPATGPGTLYPCGVDGQVCPDTSECCATDEVCGGQPFSGCPEGMCCYAGDDGFGATRAHPQREPQP